MINMGRLFFAVLGMNSQASHMLDKHSTTELHSQSKCVSLLRWESMLKEDIRL